MAERLAVIDIGARAEDIAAAHATVERLKAETAFAEAQLEKFIIRSPIAGVILRRQRNAGEAVTNVDPTQIANSQMLATKVMERDFVFGPGDDVSTFAFKKGDLELKDGKCVFFVPIMGNGVEFFVQGVGNGHSLWSTTADGTFDQYYVNWTLTPASAGPTAAARRFSKSLPGVPVTT